MNARDQEITKKLADKLEADKLDEWWDANPCTTCGGKSSTAARDLKTNKWRFGCADHPVGDAAVQ